MANYVCKQNKCTGCMACVNVCPKNCITLEDNVESLNASKDMSQCIGCGLCEKVCQVNSINKDKLEFMSTKESFDGYALDNEVFAKSSSGGFATMLGIKFINKGGYVVGVANDGDEPYFDIVNTIEDVKKFSGSKYVKVFPKDIYKKVKKILDEDNDVLFIGLPCHIAAIKLYLRKEYSNLYTVDLICHGTPSKKILNKFLDECGVNNQKLITFRNKHRMYISVNDKPVIGNGVTDSYMIGFLNGLFYTENCYECQFAQGQRVSDITIGDSWGSKNDSNNIGYSLILIQSQKGDYLKSILNDSFEFKSCDYAEAVKNNHQLKKTSEKAKYTDYFFDNYENKKVYKLVRKAYPKIYFKQQIKRLLKKFKLIK